MFERWSHAMHEVAHAKGIEIRDCVQDELPSVACQPEQISRVILNLVDNAIRHSPRKCVVVLRALAQAGEIEIQVDDSGPGFRAPAAQRVLQAEHPPVHSGDGRRGLGLLIARSIVEAHGRAVVDRVPARHRERPLLATHPRALVLGRTLTGW